MRQIYYTTILPAYKVQLREKADCEEAIIMVQISYSPDIKRLLWE